MKNKRGKDHKWFICKYTGDLAYYARCECGFKYACSASKRKEDGTWSFEQELKPLYNFCPKCGARKKWYNEEVVKIDKFVYE